MGCEIVQFLALVMLASLILVKPLQITLKDGGYQDIFVAIHRSVPEDKIIIENLKKMFISGSRYLFSATGQRLYFKDVTFILPETWSENYNLTSLFSDFYPDSHIRIAKANPEFGDAPYTLQPGECGDQGQYIHFTPKFVINENGQTFEMFGEPGKQLVHEWGHLRYGVFDEYGSTGDRRFPPFYLGNGKIRPSSCVQDVKGWIEREDGQPCTLYENNFIGDDCFFYPNEENNGQTLKASIMYLPYLSTMVSFCEGNTLDLTKKHNSRAPTKHNVFCKYKSTWEVVSKHRDLRSKKLSNDTKTEPNFHILRYVGSHERKMVLVMDHSYSMTGFNRLERLNDAARRYIWDILPSNFSLGMVVFSDRATKLTNTLVRLSDDAVRQRLSDLIPTNTSGWTSLAPGFQAAVQILKENGGKTEGASIILVTDGEDRNRDPRVAGFKEALKADRIIVNTVAMGGAADKYLEHLAAFTGGRSYYVSDFSVDASGLDSALFSSTSSQLDVDFQPITLVNEALTVTDGTVMDVTIDKELGKNTEFSFRGNDLKNIRVGLTSPDGKEYDEASPEFYQERDWLRRKRFYFQMAQPGKWFVKYNISGTDGIPVTFNLISEVLDANDQPVRVKMWFDKTDVWLPAYVKVFAQVSKGRNIIINATVRVVIVRPNEKDFPLVLRDNGAGADSIKDDGIYSTKFQAFSGNYRYTAVATVINDGNAQIKIPGPNSGRMGGSASSDQRRTRGGGGANEDKPPVAEVDASEVGTNRGSIPEHQLETTPAENFSRRNDLGDFIIRNFTPGVVFSPDRVTDLKVEYFDPPTSLHWHCNPQDTTGKIAEIVIQLKWTAVANGVDEGNVSGVEIRGSLNGDELLTDFKKGRLMVLNKTWSPLKPGQVQRTKFVLPRDMVLSQRNERTTDVYFALISVNSKSLWSEMSNVVSAHLGYTAKNNVTSPVESDEEETNVPTDKLSDNKIGLVIGIVIAGLILGALVIVLFKFAFQKND